MHASGDGDGGDGGGDGGGGSSVSRLQSDLSAWGATKLLVTVLAHPDTPSSPALEREALMLFGRLLWGGNAKAQRVVAEVLAADTNGEFFEALHASTARDLTALR